MRSIRRPPQLRAHFRAGDVQSGYYNDLTGIAAALGDPRRALARLAAITSQRSSANPVSIAQLGLGAWQLSRRDQGWLVVAESASKWIAAALEDDGSIAYGFPMSHTYALQPPWSSAMAQGESASLLVRTALMSARPELLVAARRAVAPLVASGSPLVAHTSDGPVLQEYPTRPPAHVLNGWIFALWGLYDVALETGDRIVRAAFEQGVDALEARLPLYRAARSWSRYDLYPHPIVHVSSPFYHRLHVEQLRALYELASRAAFATTADDWEKGLHSGPTLAAAVVRKAAFRALRPRWSAP